MNKIPVTTVEGLYKLTELKALEETEGGTYAAELKGADDRCYFIVDNTNGSEAVSVSLIPGDYCAGDNRELGTVDAGKTALLYVDSSFSKTAEGVTVSLVPDAIGTKLSAVEFLPVVNN
ncbi:MAG: hypothetical protein E7597_01430 [Ruminococcaceae bacterium]|nr:hypothetical protein [Oscillospiraceae bacterium]